MARRNKTSLGWLLFHVLMTFITGGIWLIVLLIKFFMSNSR